MNESLRGRETPTRPRWRTRLGDLLTRDDLFEHHDRVLARVRNPLSVVALASVASALCGLFLHPQGFLLALGLGALIAVGVAWPWFTILGLSGTLSFDRSRSREGEPVRAHLNLINRCPWGAWGLAVRSGPGSAGGVGISDLAGWKRTVIDWDVVPDRRGRYPEGVPRIESGFPFGLATSSRVLAVSNSLLVWPRTFAVGPIPEGSDGHHPDGQSPSKHPGGSGDFLGLRAYRRGDSLKRVHWPRTARLGQMVVRELESTAVPRIQVVLDADPSGHVGTGPNGSREI